MPENQFLVPQTSRYGGDFRDAVSKDRRRTETTKRPVETSETERRHIEVRQSSSNVSQKGHTKTEIHRGKRIRGVNIT